MKNFLTKFITSIGAALILAAASAGTAAAVGGPNEAGNSGKFHPHSQPCESPNDHPLCPGPH